MPTASETSSQISYPVVQTSAGTGLAKKKWGDAAQIQQDIRYKYKTHGTFLCGGGLLPTKSPSVIVPIYLIPIRPSVHLPAHAVLVC